MPDFTQARIDVFVDGCCQQSYAVDQALESYAHILDNLNALTALLDTTVDAKKLTPINSTSFLLDTWDLGAQRDKLPPRQTEQTASVLDEIHEEFLNPDGALPDNVEILATEYLYGVWYQKW